MKNYNEVASDVFEKRDRLLKQKKLRQKKAVQIGLPVVCICAVVAVISAVKAHFDTAPEQTAETVSATVAAVQTTQKSENKITINTKLPENVGMSSICDFYIDINDYVPMTKDELRTFYGTEIFPRVPDDMAEYVGHLAAGNSRSYGIYRANGGTGEVTHDNQLIMYVNREAEGNRSLEIEVSKRFRYMSVNNFGSIYTHDELTENLSCSVINGVEVYIYYHSKADYYAVNFIYNDTGFSIRADGFSEAEVVAVTESLTECGDKFKGNEYNPNPILPMIRDFEGEPLNAKVAPENGTVIMTPALQNAMEHYGDEAKYNVCITVCKSRKALDIRSDEVTAERERLVELGYITFLENYWSGEESTTVFGCHFSYEELQNFTANKDYGYILYLYDE